MADEYEKLQNNRNAFVQEIEFVRNKTSVPKQGVKTSASRTYERVVSGHQIA